MLAAPSLRREPGSAMQLATLAPWIEAQLERAVIAMEPVGGGCIHRAWRLQLSDGTRLFAKTNRGALAPVLEAEADGLAALHAAAEQIGPSDPAPVIPEPLALGTVGDRAVLVLRWLELKTGAGDAEAWRRLGAALARLHRASLQGHNGAYGWHRDNFIGAGPQPNGWRSSWATFFVEQRLGAQLALAERAGRSLPSTALLLEQAAAWLAPHQPEACLVHGDLWSGNAGLLAGGGSALFDPAVHRADREVDLAMARLFGGFPASFFAGYEAIWPLPADHLRRVELYNLYHLLNHANLFGGGYWQQSAASIQALLHRWS